MEPVLAGQLGDLFADVHFVHADTALSGVLRSQHALIDLLSG
jgi:hypothetical protein